MTLREPPAATCIALLLTVVLLASASGCVAVTEREARDQASGPAPEASRALSRSLDATTRSLRQYWSDQLPAVYGRPFQDLRGGVQAKTERSEPWACGGQRFTYADVEGNAFYCGGPQDDYIAYDAASLLPRLGEQFGPLTPSVVLAHEMGHAVQARVGVDAPSVVQELQADCFAGAWVAFAEESASDPVTVASSDLDRSVRALPALRDQPGTAATNPRAHGLAFDRVNAYQTGYQEGVVRCARFPQGEVVVTELPFRTATEAQTGGDLPYASTVQFAVADLDAYWPAALPGLTAGAAWRDPEPVAVAERPLPDCPGDEGYDPGAVAAYCTSSHSVAWSDQTLAQVHETLGDVAAASALSLAYARAGQVQAGTPSSGLAAQLVQVCATGAWLSSVGSDPEADVSLSPGDIDEGLFAVLSPLAPRQARDVETSSFERADAYRKGLLGGLERC